MMLANPSADDGADGYPRDYLPTLLTEDESSNSDIRRNSPSQSVERHEADPSGLSPSPGSPDPPYRQPSNTPPYHDVPSAPESSLGSGRTPNSEGEINEVRKTGKEVWAQGSHSPSPQTRRATIKEGLKAPITYGKRDSSEIIDEHDHGRSISSRGHGQGAREDDGPTDKGEVTVEELQNIHDRLCYFMYEITGKISALASIASATSTPNINLPSLYDELGRARVWADFLTRASFGPRQNMSETIRVALEDLNMLADRGNSASFSPNICSCRIPVALHRCHISRAIINIDISEMLPSPEVKRWWQTIQSCIELVGTPFASDTKDESRIPS